MKTYSTLVFLLFAFCSTAQNYIDSLSTLIHDIQERSSLPGFAVAIIHDGKPLYQEAFGYSNVNDKIPYTLNSLQNIGSVSKTFIGLCLMNAVEDGLINLDAPINDYLPFEVWNPHFPGQAITPRQLATHTSGIIDSRNYRKSYVLKSEIPEQMSAYTFINRIELRSVRKNKWMPYGEYLTQYLSPKGDLYLKKNFAKTAPGTNYEYSNVGATLLAFVIESATGTPFKEYSRKHILEPLGMETSGWRFEDVNMDLHANLYYPNGAQLPRYSLNTWPDGGLISSGADLTIYLQEMMEGYKGNGQLLRADSYAEMFQIKEGEDLPKGIIWSMTKRGAIQHTGGDPGIFSVLQFQPEEDFGLIFLTNCSAYDDDEQMAAFVEIWNNLKKYGKLIKG